MRNREENRESQRRVRSPQYPYFDLPTALEKVQKIWESEGRAEVDPEVAAQDMGFSGTSGSSFSALSALRKFGLIEGRGDLRLTDLALKILLPKSEDEKDGAIQEAALKPKLYKDLWEQYSSSGLPSDEALIAALVRDYKFNKKKAQPCVQDLISSLEYARFIDEARKPIQPLITDTQKEHIPDKAAKNGHEIPDRRADHGRTYKMRLGSQNIEIKLPDVLYESDLQEIQDWLKHGVWPLLKYSNLLLSGSRHKDSNSGESADGDESIDL